MTGRRTTGRDEGCKGVDSDRCGLLDGRLALVRSVWLLEETLLRRERDGRWAKTTIEWTKKKRLLWYLSLSRYTESMYVCRRSRVGISFSMCEREWEGYRGWVGTLLEGLREGIIDIP